MVLTGKNWPGLMPSVVIGALILSISVLSWVVSMAIPSVSDQPVTEFSALFQAATASSGDEENGDSTDEGNGDVAVGRPIPDRPEDGGGSSEDESGSSNPDLDLPDQLSDDYDTDGDSSDESADDEAPRSAPEVTHTTPAPKPTIWPTPPTTFLLSPVTPTQPIGGEAPTPTLGLPPMTPTPTPTLR